MTSKRILLAVAGMLVVVIAFGIVRRLRDRTTPAPTSAAAPSPVVTSNGLASASHTGSPSEAPPDTVAVFTVHINGASYTTSARIRPEAPIMATALHPDPRAETVRMQHPDNPRLSLSRPIGQTFRVTNHEGHMRAGHASTSVFIALNRDGEPLDRITLTFLP